MEYVKSSLNYQGNKFKYMGQLQKLFPKDIDTFLDLFCGGGDVVINTVAKERIANDINYHVIGIFRELQKYEKKDLLKRIDDLIARYQLSKTNKAGFEALRDHYNKSKERDPIELYVLGSYSYSYLLRFNADQEFNTSFGKDRSSFNDARRQNLIETLPKIKDVNFRVGDFTRIDYSQLTEKDFVYADPPYLLSCAVYNDGKWGFNGWSEKYERKLYDVLDELDDRGVKFAMSNQSIHRGEKHQMMIDWIRERKYNCHAIDWLDKNTTKEVLVTNYGTS